LPTINADGAARTVGVFITNPILPVILATNKNEK
jgi:hypothetical protein